MSVSLNQLDDFHRLAVHQLQMGDADSIAELARQWQAAREREEVSAAVNEAMEDLKAGTMLLPYLLSITFATVLNFEFARLNG